MVLDLSAFVDLSYGLSGMQERVDSIGGQLAMRANNGLALELRLPMGGYA